MADAKKVVDKIHKVSSWATLIATGLAAFTAALPPVLSWQGILIAVAGTLSGFGVLGDISPKK